MKATSKWGAVFMILFSLPFCGVGLFCLYQSLNEFSRQDLKQGMVLLLCALVFGGVGFLLLIGTLFGFRKITSEERRKIEFPDEPWKWREEWKSRKVQSSSKGSMLAAWGFALFWNLISTPGVFALQKEILEKKNYPALLILLFPMVGIGLLIHAIRQTIHWRKFGNAFFEPATMPGLIGGRLDGLIHVPTKLRPENGFQIALLCIHSYSTGSGKSRRQVEDVLWEKHEVLQKEFLENDPSKSVIPVSFSIPPECQASSSERSSDSIIWRLKSHAAVEGVDFDAQFEVPVFQTKGSGQQSVESDDMLKAYRAPVTESSWATDDVGVTRNAQPNAVEFQFLVSRTIKFGWISFMIGLVCIAIAALLWKTIVLTLGFGFFGLIFCLIGWSQFSPVKRIEVKSGSIFIDRGGKQQTFSMDEIREVLVKNGTSVGQTQYYDLEVVLKNRKRVNIGSSIKGKVFAEQIVGEVKEKLGL